MKYVSPSVRETAFNCPHCGVLTQQFWYKAHAVSMGRTDLPALVDLSKLDVYQKRMKVGGWRGAAGPFFEAEYPGRTIQVGNVWFSSCYNCRRVTLWAYDRIAFPQRGEAPPANQDLPAEIIRDYDEASAILDLSPRGAAALIRLAIQKLCKYLGQPGQNLNTDIKALVAQGLDSRVQMALDFVHVVGNNAIHPGQIDLRDDRATAESLFGLLNLIAEKMITEPKHVDEFYASLPENARKAIEKRDGKDPD